MEIKLKTYKKDFEYSYALGASPSIELLKNRPEDCLKVIFSPSYNDKNGKINKLCGKYNIPCEENQKIINILSPKENCYVVAVFKKRSRVLDKNKSHVVLDNPSDMGNLGTVIRSCAGFGIGGIAVIGGADIYNPKVIRASMGAFFHVDAQCFGSIYDYLALYGETREIYTFMLRADYSLSALTVNKNEIYSLIFGNEATGLDGGVYGGIGKSVVIKHNDKIDSLNLPVAAGIALFWFSN